MPNPQNATAAKTEQRQTRNVTTKGQDNENGQANERSCEGYTEEKKAKTKTPERIQDKT